MIELAQAVEETTARVLAETLGWQYSDRLDPGGPPAVTRGYLPPAPVEVVYLYAWTPDETTITGGVEVRLQVRARAKTRDRAYRLQADTHATLTAPANRKHFLNLYRLNLADLGRDPNGLTETTANYSLSISERTTQ